MSRDLKEIIIQNEQAFDTLAAVFRAAAEHPWDFRHAKDTHQMILMLHVDGDPTHFKLHLSPTGQWSLITQLNLRSEK